MQKEMNRLNTVVFVKLAAVELFISVTASGRSSRQARDLGSKTFCPSMEPTYGICD